MQNDLKEYFTCTKKIRETYILESTEKCQQEPPSIVLQNNTQSNDAQKLTFYYNFEF